MFINMYTNEVLFCIVIVMYEYNLGKKLSVAEWHETKQSAIELFDGD